MNIGIDCRTLVRKSYGIGTYTLNLVQNLLKIDQHNNYFLFFDSPDIPEYGWLTPQTKCVFLPFPGISKRAGHDFMAPLWENIVLPVSLRKLKIDVYLGTNYKLPLFSSVPGISVVHGMAPFALAGSNEPWLFKIYFKWLVRLSILKAKKIIAVSADAARDLVKYLCIAKEKITVIPLAGGTFFRKIKDANTLAAVREKYQLPEKYILFVGGLTARKNLPTLLRVFSALKIAGVSHKLVLCGGERFGSAELMTEIGRLNLENEVIFTGLVPYDETLAAIYSLADVYVLPSFHEACNLTVLEAMACEVPIVAANIPSIADEVGESAILIDPLDVDGWVKNLRRVLADQPLRLKMINSGQERIKMFSWEKNAAATLKIMESLHA